jgi:hypothetical protein
MCGVILHGRIGLDDLCAGTAYLPSSDGTLPSDYGDLCCSFSESLSESVSVMAPWPEPTNWVLYPDTTPVEFVPGDSFFEAPPWIFWRSEPQLVVLGWFCEVGLQNTTGAWSHNPNGFAGYNVVAYMPAYDDWIAQVNGKIFEGFAGAWHNLGICGKLDTDENGAYVEHHDLIAAEVDWDGFIDGRKVFRIAWYDGWSWQTLDSVEVPDISLDVAYTIIMKFDGVAGTVSATLWRAAPGWMTGMEAAATIGVIRLPTLGARRYGFMTRRAGVQIDYFCANRGPMPAR